MDDLMLILFLACLSCLITGLIKPSLVIRWGDLEKRNKKSVLKYYGIGLIVTFILFGIFTPNTSNTADESTAAQSNKVESPEDTAKRKADEKKAHYVSLLDSGKTYEAMTGQERADISELIDSWDSQEQDFKDKYQSKKDFVEKSKSDAVAKWKAEEDAKAAKAAQLAAQKAEEEKVAYDTGITYDQLARTPDNYKDKKVKFTGKVIQVLEDNGETDLRIAVGGNYDTVLLAAYDPKISTTRILENDNVTVKGVSKGIYTYQSTIGGKISVPLLVVDKIELNK